MTLLQRYEAAFMPNYGVPPVALVRGEGARVWDADGNEYLDFIGGIAVSSLGHGHPALVEAVSAQVATLAHTSNLFVNEPEVLLAERLRGLLDSSAKVFLTNSGTEANECALKLAIKYGKANGRTCFVAAENGFHGRSMGALSLTGKQSIREPFGPYGIDVRFVPYGDAEALRAAVTTNCAAVFLEPTLGEGGVVPPPEGYFRAAREICDTAGALLVADEIQSAIGRTGAWFAHQHEGVVPDILTLAKGLGGGLPIGACLGRAASVGEVLKDGLGATAHPLLAGVRGRGLWLAAVLTGPHAVAVQDAARAAGFLVNAVQPDAVRLAPPLILTTEQAQAFLGALPAILDTAQEGS